MDEVILRARRQHDRITREGRQIADSVGMIGDPFRAETLLERLYRLGDITREQQIAGEQFQDLFRVACLDPMRAMNFDMPVTGTGHNSHLGTEPAKRRINLAFDAMGGLHSPAADVCWHVLGCEMAFRDYALRKGGRMRREVAKGCLLAALSVLSQHFGHDKG